MATATTVILRQADNSEGRINNARSEQSVGLWMPADLASAEVVNTSAGDSPCGTRLPAERQRQRQQRVDADWTGYDRRHDRADPDHTIVSYRYIQNVDGEWQVIRVSCVSGGLGARRPARRSSCCTTSHHRPPACRDYPGVTPPVWVMLVGVGDRSGSTRRWHRRGRSEDPTYYVKNGRRVTVTINGGGDIAGLGGGQDAITLSAGGTDRESELGTTNLTGAPTFAATRSRCGGNFGVVVDTSGSIGSNMSYVRTGITGSSSMRSREPRSSCRSCAFSTTATTLGAGAAGRSTTTCSSSPMSTA